jgi:uncharacterized protein (TIGR02996 family)
MWRTTPARELADAIAQIGERAREGLEPPVGKTAADRNKAWNAAAKAGDAVMRGVLIESVAQTRGCNDTLARIELLAKHPDPRLAARLGDFVEDPIYNATMPRTTKFWKRIFVLLAKAGDPRLLERARAFPAAWKASKKLTGSEKDVFPKRFARDCLPLLEKEYGDGVPALSSAEAKLLAAIVDARAPAAAPASSVGEAELLAAVFANPDDDAPRMVYADWLQERGDARGELIALQLANRTGKQTARESELIATHQKKLLGSLASRVKVAGLRFERGFLARCSPKDTEPDPAWATVHTIVGSVPGEKTRVPSLRALLQISEDDVAKLSRLRGCKLEELDLWLSGGMYDALTDNEWSRIPKFVARLEKVAAFKTLKRLSFDGWIQMNLASAKSLDWMTKSPLVNRLDEIVFPLSLEQLPIAVRAIGASTAKSALFWGNTDANNYRGVGATYGWSARFERDASAALSRLRLQGPKGGAKPTPAATYGNEPLAGLAALPKTALSSVTIVIPKAAWTASQTHLRPRIEAALANQTRLDGIAWEHSK